MRQKVLLYMVLTAMAVTSVAGCTVVERPAQRVAVEQPAGDMVVTEEPPAVREEVIGVAPSALEVWLPGYWAWHDRWVWVAGYWGIPPYHGAVWAPGGWWRHSHGWAWRPGHWHR